MQTLKIRSKRIDYNTDKTYRTIQVIGGAHCSETIGAHEFRPRDIMQGFNLENQEGIATLAIELEEQLHWIEEYVREGTVSHDGFCPPLKPADETTF